jgi:hypothetical protein
MSNDPNGRKFFAGHKPWASPCFGQWTSNALSLEAIVLNEVFDGRFTKLTNIKVKRSTTDIP